MPLLNTRLLRDDSLSKTKVLPGPGLTTFLDSYTDDAGVHYLSIDIGEAINFRQEDIVVEIWIPATPALLDGKSISVLLLHSSDNLNFVPTAPTFSATVTGSGGLGGPERYIRFKLPALVNRFLELELSADAASGDCSGLWAQMSILC